MKIFIKIIVVLIAVLLFIQIPVFRPKENNSTADPVNDIATKYDMPMDVLMSLYNACYDCHSNYTKYPLYFKTQPVSWWMDYHIVKAKKHLNFSEFATYSPKKAAKKFHEIYKVCDEKTMPLKSFLLMHDEAKLTNDEYHAVMVWAQKQERKLIAEGVDTSSKSAN